MQDNVTKFTTQFDVVLKSADVEVKRNTPLSPNFAPSRVEIAGRDSETRHSSPRRHGDGNGVRLSRRSAGLFPDALEFFVGPAVRTGI